jgi:phage-related protein
MPPLAGAYKNLYRMPVADVAKAMKFCGGALDDLRAFPGSARRDAGYELDKVQNRRDPSDWKPMSSVGAGVREIRIRDASGASGCST